MNEERKKLAAKNSEQDRLEQKLRKEEDIAVCYVCNSGEHFGDASEEHSIVFCDRCCVAVHTSCYGAEEVKDAGGEGWRAHAVLLPASLFGPLAVHPA